MRKLIQTTFIAMLVITTGICKAQEFKLDVKSAEQIVITKMLGKITVTESDGNELTIIGDDVPKIPEKAKGLKPISNTGAVDNTGIGLEVTEESGKIFIKGATKKCREIEYQFKVPKGSALKIDYNYPMTNGDIDISGYSGELEIETMTEDINLEKVTGPLILYSISGDINVKFDKVKQDAPISITCVSGDVDVAMPASTTTNLKISTTTGEVYTDFDLKLDQKGKDGLSFIGGGHNDLKTELNGGGVNMLLKSVSGDVYLRKQ